MTQIGERPPRFAIQVNSRARVTRDYAYFLENRLRARYGMDGVPLIIDFVERGQRGRGAARARARARRRCALRLDLPALAATRPGRRDPGADRRSHERAFRQRVPVHLRVGHGGPPGQDRRPDLRRRARRRAARRPVRPRGVRDARQHRPDRRLRRDLDRRPTSTSRRSRARRCARSATTTPTRLRLPTPARCSTRSTSSRRTSPRASTRPTRRAPTPADDDELDVAGAGDQGMMFGYATQRDRRADAAADLARAPARQAPVGGAQGRGRCPTCAPTARPRSPSATATAGRWRSRRS